MIEEIDRHIENGNPNLALDSFRGQAFPLIKKTLPVSATIKFETDVYKNAVAELKRQIQLFDNLIGSNEEINKLFGEEVSNHQENIIGIPLMEGQVPLDPNDEIDALTALKREMARLQHSLQERIEIIE